MPKQKITKEMVVNAAFEVARAGGIEQVLVKAIAERLGCSVQPIYSYCKNMEGLRSDVAECASRFVQEYIASRIDKNDLFRSTGRAYVQLAKEEPHILKMFLFRERKNITSLEELYLSEGLGVSMEQAKDMHLNMLIYTIGIGTLFSVTSPGIPADEIYEQQERAYRIFLKDALEEEKDEPKDIGDV